MEHPIRYRWNCFQIQGTRLRQEDALGVRRLDEEGALAIAVADGRAAYPQGDKASEVAVGKLLDYLGIVQSEDPLGWQLDQEGWARAIYSVHNAVRGITFGRPGPGAATSILAAQLDIHGQASVAGLGDGIAWLVSERGVEPLLSRASPEDWSRFCLGHDVGEYGAAVEVVQLQLAPGDRLVFATDGVDVIDRAVIESACRLPLDDALPGLVEAIRSAAVPRQENTTVLMVEAVSC